MKGSEVMPRALVFVWSQYFRRELFILRHKAQWIMVGRFTPEESFGGRGRVWWVRGYILTKKHQLVQINTEYTCLGDIVLYATGRQPRRDNGDTSSLWLKKSFLYRSWHTRQWAPMSSCGRIHEDAGLCCSGHRDKGESPESPLWLLPIIPAFCLPFTEWIKESWCYWVSKSCKKM